MGKFAVNLEDTQTTALKDATAETGANGWNKMVINLQLKLLNISKEMQMMIKPLKTK